MKIFATATALSQAHLTIDQFVETRGLSSEGDTGAARYYIIAPTTPLAGDVVLANGNIAKFKLAITPLTYPAANETQAGIVERATQAEVNAGVDTIRYVSPKTLKDAVPNLPAGSETTRGVLGLATNAEALAGTDTTKVMTPANVKYTLDNRAEYKAWSSIDVLKKVSSETSLVPGPNPRPCLAAINEDTFAIFQAGNNAYGYIKKYRYNKDDHSVTLLGQSPQITSSVYAGITAIGQNRIVLVAEGIGIQAYDWDGTAYTAVGSTTTISNLANPSVVALNNTDIAIWYANSAGGNTHLATYRFNGSTWSLVGTIYSLGSATVYTAITAFNSTRVVINAGGTTGERLQTMSWDGTTWSTLGSAAPDPDPSWSGSECDICAINSSDVIHIDRRADKFYILRFQNNTWSVLSTPQLTRSVNNSGFPAICALKENLFVYSDSYLMDIEIYRINEQGNNIPYRPF